MQLQAQRIIQIECKTCGKTFTGYQKRRVCDDCCTSNYKRRPCLDVKIKKYQDYLNEQPEQSLKQHLKSRV